jgi:hypothetical protein
MLQFLPAAILEQGWFRLHSFRHHTAGVPVLPPAQPVCHHVCSDVEPATVGRSGRFRISEKAKSRDLNVWEHRDPVHEGSPRSSTRRKVDGQVSGLLLCSVTACTISELDGGRKPSCKWPHPMSDNSTRRDMPTGTFLTSLVQDQLGDVACAAGG